MQLEPQTIIHFFKNKTKLFNDLTNVFYDKYINYMVYIKDNFFHVKLRAYVFMNIYHLFTVYL